MKYGHAPCLAVLLTSALTGQAGQPQVPRGTLETDLHAAWLGELLDLDVAGAARTYAAVVSDANAQPGRRLVALARLRELEHIGAVQPVSLGILDLEVPPELETGKPLAREPFDRLLAQASEHPQQLAAFVEEGERGRFHARTLVPLIPRSALDAADASVTRDHLRKLLLQLQEATKSNDTARKTELQKQLQQQSLRPHVNDEVEVRMLLHIRAFLVLRLEMDGKKTQADRQRAYFANSFYRDQRPSPPAGATADELLDLVHFNLGRLRNGKDLLQGEADALQKLQDLLDAEAASKGPGAALLLVNRLPYYSRQLQLPRTR